jgi:hypothetical protein
MTSRAWPSPVHRDLGERADLDREEEALSPSSVLHAGQFIESRIS